MRRPWKVLLLAGLVMNIFSPKKPAKVVLSGFPWTVVTILIVEAMERFAFYGASLLFVGYMQEMLGIQAQIASTIKSAFNFAAFGTGVFGSYFADKYIGRYKTIVYFGVLYIAGLVILTLSAFPFAFNVYPDAANGIAADASGSFAEWGFYVSLVLLGFGTGAIKANIGPMMADQVVDKDDASSERVFRWFYWAINSGGCFGMLWGPQSHLLLGPPASTGSEGSSYWLSYLVCFGLIFVAYIAFCFAKNYYIHKKPNGQAYTMFFKIVRSAMRDGWENAEGSENDVKDVRRCMNAFKLFLIFPIFFCSYNQMQDTYINQARFMSRPSWMGLRSFEHVRWVEYHHPYPCG